VAKNDAGTTEVPFKVELQSIPPTFTKKLPSALDAVQGEPLILQCQVDGSPLPSVQWFKDGKEIVPSEQ